MTILEALQWANNKLKKVGMESPMLDAEILLASILDVPKSWLFGHIADTLKPHQEEKFSLLIDRRAKFEPVAYLTGKKEFFGRDFHVSPSVLIPRPATEHMIECALARFHDADPEKTMCVDVGTGSGAIAITLALETHTPVLAIDVEQDALQIAKKNAAAHGTQEQIDFQQGNLIDPLVKLFETIHATGNPQISSVYPFRDLIICANLPYLTNTQIEHLDRDVRFEPLRALVAGVDGLDAYFSLLREIKKHRGLFPRRLSLLMEIDPFQTNAISKLVKHNFPDAEVVIEKDLQGNDRIVYVEL